MSMSSRRAIAVVARREITSRVRERAFLVSTSLTILLLVAVAVLPAVFGAGDPEKVTLRAAGEQAERIATAAAGNGPALDLDVTVERAADEAAARAAVEDEEADAALAGDPVRIVVRDELGTDLGALLQQAAADVRRAEALERAQGLDDESRDAILAPQPLAVDALDPDAGGGEQQGIASLAALLLYGQLILYGYWIAAGVVEEKSSRVVEVLLSAIRPRELLVGKLLGIGALGFAQLLLVSVVGAGAVVASGALDVPSGAWEAVAVVLAFFVLGYALYAALFAVAGATVQRQEDLQGSTMPLTILIVIAFVAAFSAVGDPDGTLARVLTFVPPCTPMVLPVRLIAGGVPAWEVAVAVLLLALTAAALVAAAVRIYAGAILRTRGRVALADAWRLQ